MSNARVQAAAEGMSKTADAHPGLTNLPTGVDQLGTNYLRTDKKPSDVPASEKPDISALENAIADAQMFAHLTIYVAERALPDDSDTSSLVRTTTWERDLLMFAAEQARKAAGNALDELAAFVEAGR